MHALSFNRIIYETMNYILGVTNISQVNCRRPMDGSLKMEYIKQFLVDYLVFQKINLTFFSRVYHFKTSKSF